MDLGRVEERNGCVARAEEEPDLGAAENDPFTSARDEIRFASGPGPTGGAFSPPRRAACYRMGETGRVRVRERGRSRCSRMAR